VNRMTWVQQRQCKSDMNTRSKGPAGNSGYPFFPAGRGYIKLLARAVRVAHFMRLAVD